MKSWEIVCWDDDKGDVRIPLNPMQIYLMREALGLQIIDLPGGQNMIKMKCEDIEGNGRPSLDLGSTWHEGLEIAKLFNINIEILTFEEIDILVHLFKANWNILNIVECCLCRREIDLLLHAEKHVHWTDRHDLNFKNKRDQVVVHIDKSRNAKGTLIAPILGIRSCKGKEIEAIKRVAIRELEQPMFTTREI